MKLYYLPISTYSQKALIALNEKELSFEPEIVALGNEEARQKYRDIYPIGKVPLLVLDNGHMIPESTIIVEYANQVSDKGPDLIPGDADNRRQVRFRDRMMDLYLNDSVSSLFFESRKPQAEQNQNLIDKSREKIDVMFGYMDSELAERTWLMGDDFTMADCAAAAPLFYAQELHPFGDKSNLAHYARRLFERPSYQSVLAEALPMLEKMRAQH
ncbi:MAG: glutathione S-transferase family protein [Gammaproteobacteria bacterium]|nr:glutathione S-transferase family protein [Gammaproteobacteria bacterium]